MTAAKKKTTKKTNPAHAGSRTAKKEALRIYLKEDHEVQIEEMIKQSGMSKTGFINKVIADYLDRTKVFAGKSELEQFTTFLKNKGGENEKGLLELLTRFFGQVRSRRKKVEAASGEVAA